jgi:nucleoside 2-deoxyribosyltransferase
MIMGKIKIYLAHPGTIKLKRKALKIQKILEQNDYIVYNPFTSGEGQVLSALWEKVPAERTMELSEQIIKADLDAIDNSDIVVAFIPEPSIGTSMEIFFAASLEIPVFIITELEHPWLICAGLIVKDVNELLEILNNDEF